MKTYILALGETKSSLVFVLKRFTTSSKLEWDIALQAANKETFLSAVRTIGSDEINIGMKDEKNAGPSENFQTIEEPSSVSLLKQNI